VIDFAVFGLPRSATAWLANWLTTDRTLCLHDPFAATMPEHWDAGGKRLGMSCTGSYLFPRWLDTLDCPVAVIEREPGEVSASLEAIGLPEDVGALKHALDATDGRRWRFADLWNEDKARELWAFLLPRIPFDAQRYRLLRNLRVETKTRTADMDTLAELLKRYG
jgi:hypothetical protein